MTKSKKIFIVAFFAALFAACGTLSFLTASGKAEAAKADFPEDLIRKSYNLNETLTLPESLTATYKGTEYVFNDSALVYPDGKAYCKESYLLDSAGKYTVVYSLKTDGLLLSAEKSFSVKDKNFSVSSVYSSAGYGSLTQEFAAATGQENGIVVSLASGDVFNYNVPIDLSKNRINDFITLYTPQYPNAADVGNIVVRLTDCYDSSVYVDFVLWYETNQAVHARAGASGQESSGFNKNPAVSVSKKPVYVDGEEYYMTFSRFGATMGHNAFVTAPAGFTWRYDVQEKEVSVTNRSGSFVKVTQLANPDIYEKNLFGGFTTGEVYLSVYAENYYESAARIEISRIDGVFGEGLNSYDYADEKSPVLNVAGIPDSETVYVAKGKTVSVFAAEAVDVSGADVTVSVFYNYESDKRSSVYLKDGKFVAERPGTYTVLYTATDVFGNTAYKKVTVNCVEFPDGKAIDFSVAKPDGLKAGYETVLPEYVAEGLNGEVTVDVFAKFGNERIKIENGSFIPMHVGVYEIEYVYYDSFDSYTYSYEIESRASDAVRFLDEIITPRYFIKNAEYSLIDLKAYVFNDTDGKAQNSEFYVKFDDGEFVKSNVNCFKVTGNESVTVKYVYGDCSVESSPVTIVDARFDSTFALSEYFQGDFTAEEDSSRIRYTSNVSEGNNVMRFVNALSFANFRFDFSVPIGAYYKSLGIRLTDCYDENNVTEIEFYGVTGALGATVNGTAYKSDGSFADNGIKSLYYDNATKKLILPGGTAIPFENPFTNDVFFLDVELRDIGGDAYVDIRMVNNQPFTTTYFDIIAPEISIKDKSGKHDIGEKITLEPAVYTDVISPVLRGRLTVEVLDPFDNFVVSDEGITLDGTTLASETYTITLSSYGNYRINYKTIDQGGNVTNMPCVINVEDDVKPTVTINGKDTVTVKYLSVYKIDNYTVSDNLSAAENLEVTVIVVDKKQNSVVSIGNEFEAKYTGTYVAYVYCTDEAGNAEYASFTIIVE